MVNPDGVSLGNSRANFTGYDLNRCWLKPDQHKHPEIYLIKNQIRRLSKQYKLELVLDLHGHSRKYDLIYSGWVVFSMEITGVKTTNSFHTSQVMVTLWCLMPKAHLTPILISSLKPKLLE